MNLYDITDCAGAETNASSPNPPLAEVKRYLASLADDFRLPRKLVQAVAQTQSSLDPRRLRSNPASTRDAMAQLVPANQSYGVM